jgi:hypothetical protein
MNKFLSDVENNNLIQKLNVCYSPFHQWEQRKAQKNHIDLFGKEIMEGEIYFRLRLDLNYSNDLKLSIGSMDRFLFAIFAPRPSWEIAAANEIEKKHDEIREIINKLRK